MARMGDIFVRSAIRRGNVGQHLLSPLALNLYMPDEEQEDKLHVAAGSGDAVIAPITTFFDQRPAMHPDEVSVTGAGVALPEGVYDVAAVLWLEEDATSGQVWLEPTLDGDSQLGASALVGPYDTVPIVFVTHSQSAVTLMRMVIEDEQVLGAQVTSFDTVENWAVAQLSIVKVV